MAKTYTEQGLRRILPTGIGGIFFYLLNCTAMTMPHVFRLPLRAARLGLTRDIGLSVAGIALGSFYAGKVSLPVLAVAAILLGVIATGRYLIARMRIWVTVSDRGMEGKSFLFFSRMLPWSDINTVFEIPMPFRISGYSVGRGDEMGVPLPFKSLFIPAAIYHSPEFLAAVIAFAPAGHPLIRKRANAT